MSPVAPGPSGRAAVPEPVAIAPAGPPSRRRWVASGQEALGAAVALALAVIALGHVLVTERVALLWYDGDSVLLPLVERSIRLGQPFEWAMSPALFFFPELPVYLLCSLVTATPQQALALNGVLVLLAVYALVRAAANELMPAARRSARIAVSAVALGFVTAIVLTEYTATATSLELGSLLLTTTYYYGAVLAMLGTAVLVLRAVRTGRASVVVLVVTGLVAACTTASNPLYVPWSAAPVVVTLVLLSLARRVPGVRPGGCRPSSSPVPSSGTCSGSRSPRSCRSTRRPTCTRSRRAGRSPSSRR